jgi:hypothetical protein
MAVIWIDSRRFAPAVALDPDAAAYIAAVEAADTQALEPAVRAAINDFVVGCKADGIWNAIKASCILAGARTLTGALVPLVGATPTNFNFVAGDYNRKTGLVGNGSTKYLNSNYAYASGLQNNKHVSVFASTSQQPTASPIVYAGSSLSTEEGRARTQIIILETNNLKLASRCSDETTATSAGNNNANGLMAVSRALSASYIQRGNATSESINVTSLTGAENNMFIFRRNNPVSALYATARLAFYSIGESLDLALLDARVTALINAFDAAI